MMKSALQSTAKRVEEKTNDLDRDEQLSKADILWDQRLGLGLDYARSVEHLPFLQRLKSKR